MPSITCPVCLMTSYHPMDVRTGDCGSCHDYTSVGSDGIELPLPRPDRPTVPLAPATDKA